MQNSSNSIENTNQTPPTTPTQGTPKTPKSNTHTITNKDNFVVTLSIRKSIDAKDEKGQFVAYEIAIDDEFGKRVTVRRYTDFRHLYDRVYMFVFLLKVFSSYFHLYILFILALIGIS
jgi:hypothetical protein